MTQLMKFARISASLAIAFGILFLFVLCFQVAWNKALTKGVDNTREITYWQAFGIMFLISVAGGLFHSRKMMA